MNSTDLPRRFGVLILVGHSLLVPIATAVLIASFDRSRDADYAPFPFWAVDLGRALIVVAVWALLILGISLVIGVLAFAG